MDPKQRIEDLLIICGRLADLLHLENSALREQRGEDVRALLDDKAVLSRAYESRVGGLIEKSELLVDVDPTLRQKLRAIGERVRNLMSENERLLQVSLEAHRRVVEVIAEAVKSSQPSAGTYSRAGTIGQTTNRATAHGAPLTVNRSL